MMIEGSGYDTLIDGGTSGHAIDINTSNVDVSSLRVSTTSGGGNNYSGIRVRSGSDGCSVSLVICEESDDLGIDNQGTDFLLSNCRFGSNIEGGGFFCAAGSARSIVTGCIANGIFGGRVEGGDSIIANSISEGGSDGFSVAAGADSLIGGCRVHNVTDDAIAGNQSTGCIIYNNRISDSGGEDIDPGSGMIEDGNLIT
jgi:hypothetical protein